MIECSDISVSCVVAVYVASETGSPITGTCVGLGNELYPEAGVAGKPIPGFDGQLILLLIFCWFRQ